MISKFGLIIIFLHHTGPLYSQVTSTYRQLDPLGETHGRPTISGAIRLDSGLQVDESCLTIVQKQMKMSQSQIRLKLNDTVEKTFKNVTTCMNKYPELSNGKNSPLKQWIAQARRTLIRCKDISWKKFGRDGVNYLGLFHQKSKLYKTTITYPRDSILSAVTGDNNIRVNELRLFHEIAHSTTLNNRDDHRKIENISWEYPKMCEDNIADDRIEMVAMLCTDKTWYKARTNADEMIYKRISNCGLKKGCTNLFTSTNGALSRLLVSSSSSLKESKAKTLCQRIYNDGFCRQKKRVYGPNWTRNNSQLKAISKQIKDKLRSILPRKNNELPRSLISLYPSLNSGLNALSSTSCFQSVFQKSKNSSYRVPSTSNIHLQSNRLDEQLLEITEDDKLIFKITNHIKGSPECQNEYGKKILDITKELFKILRKTFNDPFYQEIINKRINSKAESTYFVKDQSSLRTFEKILGKKLLSDYLKYLKIYHYKSPNFDCFKNGFYPIFSLEEILKSSISKSCH